MKICLLNGLPYHYEMFGYIIYYCKKYDINLDIYTNFMDKEWLIFYNKIFSINFINIQDFINNKTFLDKYECILFTTEDDKIQRQIYLTETHYKKSICIDHWYEIRNYKIPLKNHIATRPFKNNFRKWALPCYEYLNINEKLKYLKTDEINLVILGGSPYNMNLINKITCLDKNFKIKLNIISRNINKKYFINNLNNNNINIELHENLNTIQMIKYIIESDYILTDFSADLEHIYNKMSADTVNQ